MAIDTDFMPLTVFEEYADDYDQWFVDNRDVYLDELKRVRQAIGDIPSPALEIGVGSGRFAKPLGIRYGIDPSRALGLMAKDRGIEVIRAVGEAVPMKPGIIRMVVMITVLCFLKKPEEAFREVHRILMHEGKLLVACIEKGGIIAERYQARPDKGRFLSHARFYEHDEVIRMITGTGFDITSIDCRLGFCILTFHRRDKI
ncbi:class I SAM-dependent methyltransferase [Methanospirillum hungatei]|uniref:class I SAM-dependent methyltransferase n=1 Tax=Methanospirillum hungatei TaxID=2203 RepID=UPI0026F22DBE|nr:methyltransferase domain-containing protein [Methanospirillum hungatei]MCA1917613.1 methyltransferase domain-containing protein [Methanospirillum hungatei]